MKLSVEVMSLQATASLCLLSFVSSIILTWWPWEFLMWEGSC